MSPATPLDATAAVSTDAGARVTLRVPRRTRVGLHLLAVLAWPATAAPADDFADLGWDELGSVTAGDFTVALLRRAAAAEEPATYEFAFDAALAGGDPAPAGAMIVSTGIASAGGAVDVEATEIVSPAAFVAPSADATTYSDMQLCVFYAGLDEEFVLDELLVAIAGSDGANDATIAVGFAMPEQAGATATMDATLSAADGIAATFLVPATTAAAAPRWDDEIAIGLPTVGV